MDVMKVSEAGKNNPSIQPSARNTEEGDRFNRTLFAALDALERKKIAHALIGGVAASGLGRPRSTHDIDVFVRPEDAECALEALDSSGFKTEMTDPNWLFKGFKENILVDVIFKSEGDIYFDDEMDRRAVQVNYHGRKVRAVAPEDLMIIKCAVHTEIGPHHWHDALAILSHATLDWDYLLHRGARRAPRRLLALLLYAQSNDLLVPNRVIFELFHTIFGELPQGSTINSRSSITTFARASTRWESIHGQKEPAEYIIGRVQEALAKDGRTTEHNVKIAVAHNKLLLNGESPTAEHREAIEIVTRETAPGYDVENLIQVQDLSEPEGAESVA